MNMSKKEKENKICTTISLNKKDMEFLDDAVANRDFDSRSAVVRALIKEHMATLKFLEGYLARDKLGCETCGYDYLCARSSREINYKAIEERKLDRCPAWSIKEKGAEAP